MFGAVSVLIAAAGVAVVGAYAVTRRTRELGIRSALGAGPGQLVQLVLLRSVGVLACGLLGGSALAWLTGRALRSQLFEVSATDPRILAAAAAVFLLVGTIAAWLPARRAAAVDPAATLRAD